MLPTLPSIRKPPLQEMIRLDGRRALITGAASGIGKAASIRFVEAGADLIAVDIDEKGLVNLKKDLEKYGREVMTYPVDLSRKEEIDALWDHIRGKEPDILVNNAGIYPFRDFLKVDESLLMKVLSVNTLSTFWMCQRMIERRKGKGGVIINLGSIEAILPFREDLSHYTISKAGVIALTRSLAREYGKEFRVNVIIPGGIVTPGVLKVAKQLGFRAASAAREFLKRLPMGRMGDPDEVARVMIFLASDMASYVNGAMIPVDGGFLST